MPIFVCASVYVYKVQRSPLYLQCSIVINVRLYTFLNFLTRCFKALCYRVWWPALQLFPPSTLSGALQEAPFPLAWNRFLANKGWPRNDRFTIVKPLVALKHRFISFMIMYMRSFYSGFYARTYFSMQFGDPFLCRVQIFGSLFTRFYGPESFDVKNVLQRIELVCMSVDESYCIPGWKDCVC